MLELNRIPEAEDALRRAIFLDSAFLEAHFQIGLLRLRRGNRRAGLKSLQSALKLARAADPEQAVRSAPEMTYSRLAEVLAKEIELYSGE
jgi:chemotaxis protein methyltransferase CheR